MFKLSKLRLGGSGLDYAPALPAASVCLSFFKHSGLQSVPQRQLLKWMMFPEIVSLLTISCDNLGSSLIPNKDSIFMSDDGDMQLGSG